MASLSPYRSQPPCKRIPYGMTNFISIIRDDCYFVDKTPFIERVERANKFFFFIRPRRFGKTMTVSMLQHYYDVKDADIFEEIYGGLYIGQHPTPEHNQYLVLSLNFSTIQAGLEGYKESLDAYCNICFTEFCSRYADLLPAGTTEKLRGCRGAVEQLNVLCYGCSDAGQKIYLFLDEYDHFTNKILAEPACLDEYKCQTHGTGYLRLFFDAIKLGTSSAIERVFITGVSPVTLDDLTSGFNIGTNYSLHPDFNEMSGFTEEEVRDMLAYYASVLPFEHSVDELMDIMKPWYDNYCFSPSCYGMTTMYNSCMVLYFLDNYIGHRFTIPANLIEDNIRVDYAKLRMLIRHDKDFTHDASVIQQLVSNGFITGELKTGFPAEQIGKPENFVSLLFYFGLITLDGTYRGHTRFVIPNEVVREQIFTYLLDTYAENDLRYDAYAIQEPESCLAYDGNWKPYFQYIADTLHRYASQRDRQKGESFVHGFTLAMTCQSRFYRPVSESDTQAGYADIFLRPRLETYGDMKHSYIVELKYAKTADSDDRVAILREAAVAQVKRYAASETVGEAIGPTMLHRLVIVYRGTEMVVCEEVLP